MNLNKTKTDRFTTLTANLEECELVKLDGKTIEKVSLTKLLGTYNVKLSIKYENQHRSHHENYWQFVLCTQTFTHTDENGILLRSIYK